MDKTFDPADARRDAAIAGWELQNMLTVCSLITSAAYTRTESRGAHFRTRLSRARRRRTGGCTCSGNDHPRSRFGRRSIEPRRILRRKFPINIVIAELAMSEREPVPLEATKFPQGAAAFHDSSCQCGLRIVTGSQNLRAAMRAGTHK